MYEQYESLEQRLSVYDLALTFMGMTDEAIDKRMARLDKPTKIKLGMLCNMDPGIFDMKNVEMRYYRLKNCIFNLNKRL